MNNRPLDPAITAQWESGELGCSEAHVVVSPDSVHEDVDQALAMKLVSIRLPTSLIETLKMIAEHHGIAYQPMVRDLLTRFARSEMQQIANELDARLSASQASDESSPPVEAFIQRTRRVVNG